MNVNFGLHATLGSLKIYNAEEFVLYEAAPEMKNHLSMLGSIGAGASSSFAGM
jgi:hypothetical protein